LVTQWHIDDNAEMYKKILNIGTKNMPGRFADTVLYLTQDKFQKEDIFNHISRQDIADYSAMSIKSMMKYYMEFKNDKLILLSGKKIIINNLATIQLLSRVS